MAQYCSGGKAKPSFYVPVAGTHGWDEDDYKFQWWERGSLFNLFAAEHDLILHPRTPFEWSTALDGTFLNNGFAIWKAAAKHLVCHLEPIHLFDRNIIAHSHGGQVALLAAFYGCKIRNLITVGTPVRKEIDAILPAAIGNIGNWVAITDTKRDWWNLFGAMFDGRLGVNRFYELADRKVDIRDSGAGHTGILEKKEHFHVWDDSGNLLEELKKDRARIS